MEKKWKRNQQRLRMMKKDIGRKINTLFENQLVKIIYLKGISKDMFCFKKCFS